jgi:putative Mg2+ transporter-C (MgtC) family protein
MDLTYIEILGPVNYYFGMGIKILAALFVGGLIGLDREKKMKAAGIKTNVLICLGATLYTAVSLHNMILFPGSNIDPNRVAAQVVSGIGFLGAGAILRSRGTVIGLTTSATIWVVAAVGVCIGSGHVITALIFTLTVLIVLKLLDPIYHFLDLDKKYLLEVVSTTSVRDTIREIFLGQTFRLSDMKEEKLEFTDSQRYLTQVNIMASPKQMKYFKDEISALGSVEKVTMEFYEVK